jgi:hypothetical protein
MNDELVCRHCGQPKATYYFVCPQCWKLLPRNFRVAFAKLKGQCFWWLREHAPKAQSSQLKP